MGSDGPTIKVGVNLLWLRSGRVGGSEEYAARVLAAVPPDGPIRLTLFASPGFAEAHPSLVERHEVVTWRLGQARLLRVLVENTWLAAQCRRRGVAVVHHLGGTVPWVGTRPAIVTIHDLQPLDHPKRFSLVKRLYLRVMLPWSVRRAEAIVTVSEFCRGRLGGAPGSRSPAGGSRCLLRSNASSSMASDMPLAAAAPDLAHPFVLYPALTYPHKNHEVLLRVAGSFGHRRGGCGAGDHSGGPDRSTPSWISWPANSEWADRWHRLGRIPSSSAGWPLPPSRGLGVPVEI